MDRFGVSQDSADARENGGVWISDDQQVPDAKTFYANSGDGMAMLSHYVYSMTNVRLRELTPVSYTHLDVYKRQALRPTRSSLRSTAAT